MGLVGSAFGAAVVIVGTLVILVGIVATFAATIVALVQGTDELRNYINNDRN